LPQFGECPLPSPPPLGREQVAADFAVSGRLKIGYATKELANITFYTIERFVLGFQTSLHSLIMKQYINQMEDIDK